MNLSEIHKHTVEKTWIFWSWSLWYTWLPMCFK